MNQVHEIALGGGLLAVLTFIHFAVDWILQTHSEAMVKHNTPIVRAKHCLIYMLGFFPIMWLFNFEAWELVFGMNILFWSHFIEDTYVPVFLWAKYIRKPPEMTEPWKEPYTDWTGETRFRLHAPDAKRGFGFWIQTTIGKILMLAIDQIIHIIFLLPIVWMAMRHIL